MAAKDRGHPRGDTQRDAEAMPTSHGKMISITIGVASERRSITTKYQNSNPKSKTIPSASANESTKQASINPKIAVATDRTRGRRHGAMLQCSLNLESQNRPRQNLRTRGTYRDLPAYS